MEAIPVRSPDPRPVTHLALFTAFLKVGVLGFGGVAAWVRHVLVVERSWMSEQEFAELFGVSSTLPGANTINLAILFSDRHLGPTGIVAALAGLVGAPLGVLILVASLYGRFSDLPDVQAAIAGAAAAAAGIVLGTAFRLFKTVAVDKSTIGIVACVFAASGLLHLPILATLAFAIPLSAAIVFSRTRQG